MATFSNTYGAEPMLAAVADAIKSVENDVVDIHTITLVLNGQHGEFDLVVEATDDVNDCLEDRKWTGVAHRTGGVSSFNEVTV